MSVQRLLIGTAEALGDDEVAVIAITAGVKRDGCEWVPSGVDLTNYARNPVVLFQHDQGRPIGVAALALSGNQIEGRIRFAPAGISADADTARGLAKSGVLTGVSAGIDPIDVEPLDPRDPRGGVRILRSELLEISLVAVNADPDARVVARHQIAPARRAALVRRLPQVPHGAMAQLRAALAQAPDARRLVVAAARCGEVLTEARIAQITAEARRLGRDPADWYEWQRAAGRIANAGADDFAERQAELRDLRR